MDTNSIVRILAVNTGSAAEVITEKFEVPASDGQEKIKALVLGQLNKMSKTSHVLIKFGGKLYKCDHTASRGPSSDYLRSEIRYHPYAAQIA